jgi:hypothetical protein
MSAQMSSNLIKQQKRVSGSVLPIFINFHHGLVLVQAVDVSLILVAFESGAYPHPVHFPINYVRELLIRISFVEAYSQDISPNKFKSDITVDEIIRINHTNFYNF